MENVDLVKSNHHWRIWKYRIKSHCSITTPMAVIVQWRDKDIVENKINETIVVVIGNERSL